MNVRTLLDRFDLLADIPGAVPKLRELVLELAVRGKLTKRCLHDDLTNLDASVDVEGVAPFEIPQHWSWTKLSSLGQTKPRNNIADDVTVGFVPMSSVCVRYGESPSHEPRPWGEIKKGYTHLADGDVVLAKITPCFENGKSGRIHGLPNGIGAGTTELHVFRNGSAGIVPEFLVAYLKTSGFIRRGEVRMTGSAGQKRVPHDYFAHSPIPLPPLAEQKRIVARVDELMAILDDLEARQRERNERHAALSRAALARFAEAPTPENLKLLFHPSYTIAPADLRKTILTLSVQGKLVEPDDHDEPISMFLERIWSDRTDSRFALIDLRKAPPFSVPPHWQWVVLAEVAEFSIGKTPPRGDSSFWFPEKHRWVSIADMKHYGTITNTKEKVSSLAAEAIFRQRFAAAGSILMSFKLTIGKIARTSVPCFHNEAIISLKPPEPELFDFLFRFLPVCATHQVSNNAIKGSTLNKGLLAQIPIPLPPLAEQRRIIARVEELMALVDELEAQLAAARTAGERLLEAVVAEVTAAPPAAAPPDASPKRPPRRKERRHAPV